MELRDILSFDIPSNQTAKIKVIGVGGGGGNAVRHMYNEGIEGVDFIVFNTDAQVLKNMQIPNRIQIGSQLTEGLGAGNQPGVGRDAAIESIDAIIDQLDDNTKMIFITAGMGGGTGTGAAPVIAQAAKELGILTIAIVTLPFPYEGKLRFQHAKEGINELNKYVDALLVIDNAKLREIYGNLELSEALCKADDILKVAAKGIAEIITREGTINVDFADVRTVMSNSGVALMGTGRASGERRAIEVVEKAISSPLLNNNDISGSKRILLNIVSGVKPITMDETDYINKTIQEKSGNKAELIWGCSTNKELGDEIEVTVIATGFADSALPELFDKHIEITKIDIEKEETTIQKEISNKEQFTNLKAEPENIEIRISDPYNDMEEITLKTKPEESEKKEITLKQEVKKQIETSNVKKGITTFSSNERLGGIKPISSYSHEDFLKIENIPAYKRRNVQVNIEPQVDKNTCSFYTIDKKEDMVRFNENNPYLYDKAD